MNRIDPNYNLSKIIPLKSSNSQESMLLKRTDSLDNKNREQQTNQNQEDISEPKIPSATIISGQDLNKQFDSYASVKTYAAGFFNIALVTTNAVQLKQLITPTPPDITDGLTILLIACVCMSILLQIIVSVILVFMAKQSEFVDDEKRDALVKSNNWATILISAVSIINVLLIFLLVFNE